MLQQIRELLSLSLSLYTVAFAATGRDNFLRANVASLENSDVRYLTSDVQDGRFRPLRECGGDRIFSLSVSLFFAGRL